MVLGIAIGVPFYKAGGGFELIIPPVWILATTDWEDRGVWMDGETWND